MADPPDIEERTIGGLTVRIDRDLCVSSKACIHAAPEVFELGADQVVTFRADAQAIDRERLVEACAVCPTDALTAIDEAGRQLAPR